MLHSLSRASRAQTLVPQKFLFFEVKFFGATTKVGPPKGTTKWSPKWNPLKNEITAVIAREVQSVLSCRPIRSQRRQGRRGRNIDEPRDKAQRAVVSLLLEIFPQLGLGGRWLNMRGAFSQFPYILCFRGCRNRKSWTARSLGKAQKWAKSLPRSSFLTTPHRRLRPLAKTTSTPTLSNSA